MTDLFIFNYSKSKHQKKSTINNKYYVTYSYMCVRDNRVIIGNVQLRCLWSTKCIVHFISNYQCACNVYVRAHDVHVDAGNHFRGLLYYRGTVYLSLGNKFQKQLIRSTLYNRAFLHTHFTVIPFIFIKY